MSHPQRKLAGFRRLTMPVKCLGCGSVYEYRGNGAVCVCPHCRRRPARAGGEKK